MAGLNNGVFKWPARDSDSAGVEQQPRLERCPYDGTAIVANAYAGGFVLLSCEWCGASWELHNLLVRRVTEPDWAAVDAVRDAPRSSVTHLDTPPA